MNTSVFKVPIMVWLFAMLGIVKKVSLLLTLLIPMMVLSNHAFATCNFTDVDEFDPSYKAIQFLCDRGIVKGYSDGNFQPNSPIKRLELAKIAVLSKASSDGKDVPAYMEELKAEAEQEHLQNPSFLTQFADRDSLMTPVVWDELGGIIYYVSQNRIIEGRQDKLTNTRTFAPHSDITRGEAIKVFAVTLEKTSALSLCLGLPYNISAQYGFCPHINALHWGNGPFGIGDYLNGLVRGNYNAITDKYFNSQLRRGEMAILGCNAIALSEGLNIANTCLSANASCFLDQSLVGEKFIYKTPTEGGIFADDALARVSLHWSNACGKNWAVVTPAPIYADKLLSSSATVTDDVGQNLTGTYICQNKEGLDSICSPFLGTDKNGCAYAIGSIDGYTAKAIQGGCHDDGQYSNPDYIHVEHDNKHDGKDVNHTVVFSGEQEIGRFQDLQTGDGRYTYTDPSDTLTSLERGSAERYDCDISLADFKAAFNLPEYKTEYGIPCRYERKIFFDFMDESRNFFNHEAVLFINTQELTATAWFKKSHEYEYWATQADVIPKLQNAGLDLSDNQDSFYFSPAVATFLWYNNPEGVWNSVSTVYYEPTTAGGEAHVVQDEFLKTLITEGFNAEDWCKVVSQQTISQCGASSKDKSTVAYLGFPTSDKADAAPFEGKSGKYQNFIGGQIYESGEGTYYVYGPLAIVLNTSILDPFGDGKVGSSAYGFPQKPPIYDVSANCIAQDFSSGWSITSCGDDFAGILKGEYTIALNKTQELINSENFKEGFYDTFAEISIYGIAFELVQDIAFDKALHLFSKISVPIGKRFGKTLVAKISKKVAVRLAPGVGWILLGVDAGVTAYEIAPLIEACNNDKDTNDKPPEYYCGKAIAYGLFIGALGTSEFASPVAKSKFGVSLTSNFAISGKSKLFEKFPTIDPKASGCRLRTKFAACDLFGGQKAFEEKMQNFSGSERTTFFNDIDKLDGPAIGIISNATKPFYKAVDMSIVHDVKTHLKSATPDGISNYFIKRGVLVENGALSTSKESIARLYGDGTTLKPSTEFEFSSLLYRDKVKSSDKTQFKYISEKNGYKNPDFEELCKGKVVRIFESKQVQALIPRTQNLYDNVLTGGFGKRKNTEVSLLPKHENKPMGILLDIESPNLESDGINSNDESSFLNYLNDNIKEEGIVKANDTVTIRTKYDIYEYFYNGSVWSKGYFELCN